MRSVVVETRVLSPVQFFFSLFFLSILLPSFFSSSFFFLHRSRERTRRRARHWHENEIAPGTRDAFLEFRTEELCLRLMYERTFLTIRKDSPATRKRMKRLTINSMWRIKLKYKSFTIYISNETYKFIENNSLLSLWVYLFISLRKKRKRTWKVYM